ncbi:hypothetical protein GEMRC1_005559 [Eukaryota sp. GEM-RC1]
MAPQSDILNNVETTSFSENPLNLHHINVDSNSCDIVSQLFYNKQNQLLTDSLVFFHGQAYPCRSDVISSFSLVLKEKLLNSYHEVHFSQLESITSDADIFFRILDYCYGQPFELTLDNFTIIITISSLLEVTSLTQSIGKIISQGLSESRRLQMKSEEVLQTIRSNVQQDVLLSFKDKSLTISSLMLICSSEYFKNLFCSNFADSNERNFSYGEEFTGVSVSNFESFFKYIVGESFDLGMCNVVDFYQLAVYFKVTKLKETCNAFVSSLTSAQIYSFY